MRAPLQRFFRRYPWTAVPIVLVGLACGDGLLVGTFYGAGWLVVAVMLQVSWAPLAFIYSRLRRRSERLRKSERFALGYYFVMPLLLFTGLFFPMVNRLIA